MLTDSHTTDCPIGGVVDLLDSKPPDVPCAGITVLFFWFSSKIPIQLAVDVFELFVRQLEGTHAFCKGGAVVCRMRAYQVKGIQKPHLQRDMPNKPETHACRKCNSLDRKPSALNSRMCLPDGCKISTSHVSNSIDVCNPGILIPELLRIARGLIVEMKRPRTIYPYHSKSTCSTVSHIPTRNL